MIKVFVREKKLTQGKNGLYLDFYPPIVNRETQKQTRREHLRLYVYDKPKTELERDHNKETRMLAESIKSKRQLELQSGSYGFVATRSRKGDFLEFFQKIADGKLQGSKSNHETWLSVLKYLKKFTNEVCKFGDIDEKFCRDFRDFLLRQNQLSQNSSSRYFDKFKGAVRQAFDDKLIAENYARLVKSIKQTDTQREFLLLEEVQKLVKTPFRYEDLRRAAYFAVFTGLRYSDIEKLKWNEIQHDQGGGYSIRFRQQKTGDVENLPITAEAMEWLGSAGSPGETVFKDLRYWQCSFIDEWTTRAGIDRKITFHSFRHTNATLHLDGGTDLYTLQKLLGHKSIKTTQIYAHIIDEKKREAVNRISLS